MFSTVTSFDMTAADWKDITDDDEWDEVLTDEDDKDDDEEDEEDEDKGDE